MPPVTRTRCPSSIPCGSSGVIFPSTPLFPPRQRQRMTELILIEIAAAPAERSRGRHNPRVVKRKMSNFPTKSRSAARAAPAPPPSPPAQGLAPRRAHRHRRAARAGLTRDGWPPTSGSHHPPDPDRANQSPNLLADPCSSVAGQRSAARRLLPTAQLEPAGLQRGRRPPAPDLPSCPENSLHSSLSQRYCG